jgi:superfamily II DNA or RNA helicase
MNYCKLSKEEIKYLLAIPNVNDRKSAIQKKFIDNAIKHKHTLTIIPVGTGKTHMGITYIQRLRKITNERVIVIVPSGALKENWEHKLQGIENVDVFVINSYSMSDELTSCHSMIYDEAHRYSNEDSKFFNKIFDKTTSLYTIGLSATIEEKHISFLESKGLQSINYLSLEESNTLEITPRSEVYNVPVEFTNPEKLEYYNIQKQIEGLGDYFKCLELGNSINFMLPKALSDANVRKQMVKDLVKKGFLKDLEPGSPEFNQAVFKLDGVILGKAAKFMQLIKQRSLLLYNAENKFKVLDKILDEENQSAFIFFQSISTMDLMQRPDFLPFHSKLTKKQKKESMKEFLTSNKHIGSIKSIGEGFDIETECATLGVPFKDVEVVINFGYNSTKTSRIQNSGRAQRVNNQKLEKIARTYTLYVDDFKFAGEIISSQELVWVKKRNNGLKFVQIKEVEI